MLNEIFSNATDIKYISQPLQQQASVSLFSCKVFTLLTVYCSYMGPICPIYVVITLEKQNLFVLNVI